VKTNPFSSIYKQCKVEPLSKHPKLLLADIELAGGLCNLRCIMCPVGQNQIMRQKGFMDFTFFEQTILPQLERIGAKGIRFVRWGEPTLHPRFTEFLRLAKRQGFLVHFNTNGMLFDEELARFAITNEIDSIKFSFQGTNENEYERIRRGGRWDTMCKWIKYLSKQRGNGNYPRIEIGTTAAEISDKQRESFRKYFDGVVDTISFGKTRSFGNDADRGNNPKCWEFNKASINWDGTVSFCCADYDNMMLIGDLKVQTLYDIWNGEQAIQYRQMLMSNKHGLLPLCKCCIG
jgi:uncharacterized Fe-S cluster-containing radical SAM superfamily protein